MIDLLRAAQADGLPLEVTPDFTSNGHGTDLQSPRCGYLHHTDARAVVSVYAAPPGSRGWDSSEWRPEVPSPRCQVYAARARPGGCRAGCPWKGKAHLVFVSAGVAYQAGMANGSRIRQAMAGQISARTSNAAAAGLPDTMNANDEAMGVEIDWAEGEGWPDDLLALVCRLMALTVRVFRWPGVGSWIRHRQATKRKIDPDTDYDFWTGAQRVLDGATTEDDEMADPAVVPLLQSIDGRLKGMYDSGFAARTSDGKPDPTHMDVSVRGVNQNLGQLEVQGSTLIAMLESTNAMLATLLERLPAPPAT
jgi:hypothetical protein